MYSVSVLYWVLHNQNLEPKWDLSFYSSSSFYFRLYFFCLPIFLVWKHVFFINLELLIVWNGKPLGTRNSNKNMMVKQYKEEGLRGDRSVIRPTVIGEDCGGLSDCKELVNCLNYRNYRSGF